MLSKYFSAGGKQLLDTIFSGWKHFVIAMKQEEEMYSVLRKRQDEGAKLIKKVKQAEKLRAGLEEENTLKQKRLDEVEQEFQYWQETMMKLRKVAQDSSRAVDESEEF